MGNEFESFFSPGGHAGEDHDPEGEQLEVSGEDGGALGVDHVLARQRTLHDHLQSEGYETASLLMWRFPISTQ